MLNIFKGVGLANLSAVRPKICGGWLTVQVADDDCTSICWSSAALSTSAWCCLPCGSCYPAALSPLLDMGFNFHAPTRCCIFGFTGFKSSLQTFLPRLNMRPSWFSPHQTNRPSRVNSNANGDFRHPLGQAASRQGPVDVAPLFRAPAREQGHENSIVRRGARIRRGGEVERAELALPDRPAVHQPRRDNVLGDELKQKSFGNWNERTCVEPNRTAV
jgi:hypothetical protein